MEFVMDAIIRLQQYEQMQRSIESPPKPVSTHHKQQSLNSSPSEGKYNNVKGSQKQQQQQQRSPLGGSGGHCALVSSAQSPTSSDPFKKPTLFKAPSNPDLKKTVVNQLNVLNNALEQLKKWEAAWKRNVRSSCRFGTSIKGLLERTTM
jgi:hypothetical protein